MNTITYEEDLQKNPLYLKLMERCSLLQEICINNWVVALPRKSSFSEQSLSNHEFMLSHILSPSEELPRSHFINLIGEEVTISEQVIKFKDNSSHRCAILFEEFYYTRDLQKFKIICIDMPLSTQFAKKSSSTNTTVRNLQESLELVHQNCSKQVERKIDNAIRNFSLRMQRSKSVDYTQFQTNLKLLYDYCVNVTGNRRVKDDPFLYMNMKIAIENIIMDAVYEKNFDIITIHFAEESQKFNKTLRRLSNISIKDFNLPTASKFLESQNLNMLKVELLKIDGSKTSLGKLTNIKSLIDAISAFEMKLTATDELLPILVYLFVKINYFHWMPTLIFIKECNLSQILNSETHSVGSALLYILTTLEAIVYFIQTNDNMSLESNQLIRSKTVEDVTCQEEYINYLFQFIRDNNEEQLNSHLHTPYSLFIQEKTASLESSLLCHPLCACASCENHKTDSSSNVNQSSHNGLRMLHAAALYNVPKIVSLLLVNEADVNAVDEKGFTATHYAAMRGHQKALFLLMHGSADINLKTKDEQTALIFASLNGHEHCVKALLFFCEHTHLAIDINAQDCEGMTALHYASQSGYDVIVDILLEYHAKATLKNHIGKMPLDYAYNSVIKKKLNDAVKYQVEELPITENEFVFIRKQDLADIFDDN
jgi:hypothetical protein